MRITRRIRISVTTERKFVVERRAEIAPRCERCGGRMISAHVSVERFGVSSREIYRLIEADKIHFLETERLEIYICPASIEKSNFDFKTPQQTIFKETQ